MVAAGGFPTVSFVIKELKNYPILDTASCSHKELNLKEAGDFVYRCS